MPYHLYDDPICNCSIAFGTEFFDVQKARNRFPERSRRLFITRHGCGDRHAGGSGISQDQEAGCRSNGADDYFLLSSFGRQGPLSGN